MPHVRLALATLLLAAAGAVYAQAWPAKPIRWLNPSAAGGPPDIVVRLIAERLAVALGQPVVVENRPGAVGTIGLAEVLRQPADGYTVTNIFMPVAVAQTLLPRQFDLTKDFQPVTQLVWQYNVLVVPAASSARTLADLVGQMRAKPGALSFASAGNGTPAHLAAELFKQTAGLDAVHVPYKTFPQAVTDLMAGQTAFMFAAMGPIVQHIRAGKLQPLAIASPQRHPLLPEVPTMAELGYPAIQIRDWQGVLVKAGTPRAVTERLNAEIVRIVAGAETRERLERIGAEAQTGTPEAFGELVQSEVARWGKLVREAGIKPD
jgi:tripartite-type tricarboxylate transporter receptor subunit TctC